MEENKLLERITYNPQIYGGKAIVRGRRLAVEHVLDLLASGHSEKDLFADYPWLEKEDISACLVYAARTIGNETVEPVLAKIA